MNKLRFTLMALAIMAFTLMISSSAQAQATRTWVSGVGDDANPCSRTAPCKTFAGAISKTAAGGEIDALDSGGFGAVTITKSITIDGDSNLAGILAAGTNGVIINAGATDIIQLRNLSINGAITGLTGIRILAGLQVFIEDCVVFNFRSGAGLGIQDIRTTPSARLYVLGTLVKYNSADGLSIGSTTAGANNTVTATVDNSRFLGNGGSGIFAGGGSRVSVSRSQSTGNTGGAGIVVSNQSGSAAEAMIVSSILSNNAFGILLSGSAMCRIGDDTITNNTNQGLVLSSGTVESFGNNNIRGNSGNQAPSANVGQQ